MTAKPLTIFRSLLPLATVLLCVALTFLVSNSYWLSERIKTLHHDPFTIMKSLNGLLMAQVLIPEILIAALLIFTLVLKEHRKSHTNEWEWQRNFILCAIAGTVTLALRFWQCPLAQDDSYIDYRYVQHWLNNAADYNVNERVMGFTSHLHLGILWAVCAAMRSISIDQVSYYLNCFVDLINTVFLFFLVLKVYKRPLPAFLAAMTLAVSTFGCSQVIAGKESSLVAFVILLCLAAYQTNKLAVLPWCAFALFLLRPEGILSTGLILYTTFKAQGKKALKSLIAPAVLTAMVYLYLFSYFGTVIPHGMLAKHKVLIPADFVTTFFTYLSACGAQMTNSCLGLSLAGMENSPFLPATLAIFAFSIVFLKDRPWNLYVRMAVLQLLFILFVQSIIFSWYLCWFTLLVPLAVAHLTALAWPQEKRSLSISLVSARIAACLFLYAYMRTGLFFAPFAWMPYLERGVTYRDAALYLHDLTGGKETVAASDIGIIGYYYEGPILDLMGLISDKTLAYYPIKGHTSGPFLIAPAVVAAFKPKYIAAPLSHCQDMLLEDAFFKANYTELKRWTNPAMKDKVVVIWKFNQSEDSAQ